MSSGDDENSETLSAHSSDFDYDDEHEEEDLTYRPTPSPASSDSDSDDDLSAEENSMALRMGIVRRDIELIKGHFERCESKRAHIYLGLASRAGDVLDDYFKDHPAYGF